MRTEVRLEEIRAADDARQRELEHFAKAEETAIKQEYSTLRAHVSPKTYDHDLYRHHAAVCEGTGKWLFRDQSFKGWVDHSKGTTQILWLKGIPGAGRCTSRFERAMVFRVVTSFLRQNTACE